jgi:hypothetical protein
MSWRLTIGTSAGPTTVVAALVAVAFALIEHYGNSYEIAR